MSNNFNLSQLADKANSTGNLNSVTVGATTASAGAFTTLSASSTVSGTGFSTYLASPPAIGGTAASTGAFTNLAYTGTLTGGTGIVNLGSGQFYKDTSGNIALGSTSNFGYSNKEISLNTASGVSGVTLGVAGTATGFLYSGASATNLSSVGAYPIIFGTGASSTERMRIDSSGNVGIGTSSPYAASFTVGGSKWGVFNGNIGGVATTSNQGVMLGWNASNGGGEANIVWGTYYTGTAALTFSSSNGSALTEQMRIDSSGNLLVGTTAQISSSKVGIVFDGATQNGIVLKLSANTSGAGFQYFTDNSGNLCGLISRVGTTSAVVYTATSDYRLKTVIAPVSNAGQRIDALEPIEYDWNNGAGRTRGFLAHKFAEVYPNSVTGEKDAVDAEGNPVYQAMQASTSEVMADLIAEIQSLRKRVAQLESK